LNKLDISSNGIAAVQGAAQDLQRICAAGGIEFQGGFVTLTRRITNSTKQTSANTR
jgi:hypothetical protein